MMDLPEAPAQVGIVDELLLEEQPAASTSNKEDLDAKKANVRKRTKTGCLTCRRRRIKCDEGKPTCNNCIKSKRQCEGYNQRLTFKEPLGAYHHAAHFGHPMYGPQRLPEDLVNAQIQLPHLKTSSSQGPLPAIAPKPPSVDFSGALPFQYGQVYQGQPGPSNLTAPPLGFSPTQFSPQNPPPPQFFQHSGVNPNSAHSQLEADGFFKTVAPTGPHGATDLHEQDGVAGEHIPPRTSRYPPRRAEDVDTRLPQSMPQEPGYWDSDDEASMADSDDEDDVLFESQNEHLESNDLGIMVARRANASLDFYGTQLRTYTGFVNATGVLANYIPSSTNSPLNDSQTAAVFWYFVNVTGPSISLYERRPQDPSPMFQGQPVPKTRQHIWTYTLPIISLNHPALLQAILALGSLQMATLEGVPATASMKHYHLSLRRIAKNYRSPHRRTQAATLAATLLLGFYEIWNSDHAKWCKHMWGARAIIKEIPLLSMTKAVLALKWERRQRQRESQDMLQKQSDGFFSTPAEADPDMTDVDMELLSKITGTPVSYEDYGYVFGDVHQPSSRWHTERDVESYEHLCDLYWWYCKMDVYQSILGGTRLFMEYGLWTQCVPRGPVGRIDAIFGTYDHLMLLQGRLANFASLDLARKRQARKAESAGKGPQQSPPMFPGLIPSEGKFTVPTGFSPPPDPSPPSEGAEEMDLEASTAIALREWEAIRDAFETLRSKLGPDFEPLGPELGPPRQTPFGPARTYRTYSISGIWMGYYMGMVVLHRAHPSMPPIATVAAGMAAQRTGQYAHEIGRIAAGLAEDCDSMTEVSTSLGSAFIECCFCLFVAGVQFQDQAQRHWIIKRLHNIARLTGWQSARQIADGCESSWTKAAQFGRGAPYQRAPDLGHLAPPSVWLNPRRIDRKIQELDRDEGKYVVTKSEQAHYALGLLSVEHDLDRLELRDRG